MLLGRGRVADRVRPRRAPLVHGGVHGHVWRRGFDALVGFSVRADVVEHVVSAVSHEGLSSLHVERTREARYVADRG